MHSVARFRHSETRSSLMRSICALFLGALTMAALAAPVPELTGPIAWNPPANGANRDYPFHASDLNLARRGYVEEEFFYSGTANRYTIVGAPFSTAAVAGSATYKTRLIVRRPADPSKFNGVVVVDWSNVTNSYDNPAWWMRNYASFLRGGYAHVSIAAQRLAVHGAPDGLVNWSPLRYGTLNHPGDDYSYDVFSQGIQALRSNPLILGGLPIRHVIAGGLSQSAGRLQTWVNAIHPMDRVADGLMLLIPIGGAAAVTRTDSDIPVMSIRSETEFALAGRQPDSDRFRTWWVSGSSHSEYHSLLNREAIFPRDRPAASLADNCAFPTRSRIELHHVNAAALDAMVKWLDHGTPPANSPLPQYTSTSPFVVARDARDNALGGIRLASHEVPIATNRAVTCGLGGVSIPFDDATLSSLYPNHSDYVQAFRKVAEQNVRDGFLLKEDAAEMVMDAQNSVVGTGLICGPLCANIYLFANNPSTINLRDITQAYYILGGEQLLATLDRATELVAAGYVAQSQSNFAARNASFSKAIEFLQKYNEEVARLPKQARAEQAVADMLVQRADTLISRIAAEIQ
jgi:hypothetical protein